MVMGAVVRARTDGMWLNAAWRIASILLLLGLATDPSYAAKAFRTEPFDYYLKDYTSELAKLAKTLDKTPAELEAEVAAAGAAGNARQTAVAIERLLSRSPGEGALWLKLARQLVVSEPFNDQDKYQLPPKIIGAGLKAYLLAGGTPDEAEALAIAAQGFAQREDWRSALQAYKESLRLVEDQDRRQAHEQMRDEHGFRITDYKIENDANPPRVCFELSDPVSNSVSDFSPYFRQEPGSVSGVTVDGTSLCVEGLQYGARYKITARKGLPSSVDEELTKDYDYEFYVRDRAPAVRFSGKSYVLPRTGQNGIPLVSVNSSQAKLEVYRIGDRNLIDSVLDSNFLSQISGYTAEGIADRKGSKVWEGTLDTASPLNQEVTTAFPVDEALGKLQPGLYVMTAQPAVQKVEQYQDVATQWFVVSDLGLSTLKGKDGLHVFVRSIATAKPIEHAEIRLLARNNDVLARTKTGADSSAAFDQGLVNGTGGDAPALVVAQGPDDDYGFIDLTQSAFDLTDRGVAGRDPPGPIDAFVYVERGVYRRGETVHAAVLLRNDQANAIPNAPVTLIFERPDGVEYIRTVLKDEGGGGRTLDIAIIKSAMGGTWRVKAYTDPKDSPVGETSFLVEDYIPDRIEFDLTTLSETASPDQGARFSVDGRYLFGAPGAGLDLEGDISVSVDDHPFAQWPGYRFGLTDERVDTVQNTATDLPETDAGGHAEFTLMLPELPTTSRPLKADFTIGMREPGGRAVEKSATLPVRRAAVHRHQARLRCERRARRSASHVRSRRDRSRGEPDRGEERHLVVEAPHDHVSVVQLQWRLALRGDHPREQDRGRCDLDRQGCAGEAVAQHELGSVPARGAGRRLRSGERRFLLGLLLRRLEHGYARYAESRARQIERENGRHLECEDRLEARRKSDFVGRRRQAPLFARGRCSGGRQRRDAQGRAGLGYGRLCGGDPLPADRRQRQAHAGAGDRRRLVRHRPDGAHPRCEARSRQPDEAAPAAHRTNQARGLCRG